MSGKVLISTRSFAVADKEPLDLLLSRGLEPVMNPHGRKLEPAESVALLQGAVGLIAGTEKLDDAVFSAVPQLRVISRVGTGMDNVDIEAAKKRGIQVFNTPNAPTLAVAEMALGCMLSLLRQLHSCDASVRASKWSAPLGRQLTGKTVGIVGFGRIGRELARLLSPFRATLLAFDPVQDTAAASALGARYVPLEELLAQSDVVTLHMAGAKRVFDADKLGLMKKGAVLLNLARGGLVDEAALLESLRAGALAGAALDVFEAEPYVGPLRELPQVLLTPHMASATAETRKRMELEAVQNLLQGLGAEVNA